VCREEGKGENARRNFAGLGSPLHDAIVERLGPRRRRRARGAALAGQAGEEGAPERPAQGREGAILEYGHGPARALESRRPRSVERARGRDRKGTPMTENVALLEAALEESEPKVSVTWRSTSESQFSCATAQEFEDLRQQVWWFGRRLRDVRSVHAELVRVAALKAFDIRHEPIWNMLVSERDMVIIDLASWAKGLYEKGGFFKKLQGQDLQALSWKYAASELHGDRNDVTAAIDRYVQSRHALWRREAFERLFPGAKGDVPSADDLRALEGRLCTQFAPLLKDRGDHRAHKYERQSKQATSATLALEEVTEHLKACQQILSDLGALSADTSYATYWHDGEPRKDDEEAKDVVDLVLCGTIVWIIEFGPNVTRKTGDQYYWQRRKTYYERLHAEHDARGEPDKPFNRMPILEPV
jgi:hypothetical protein